MTEKTDKSSRMSLPRSKTIHGIKIEKVPMGKYLEVMQDMNDLPQLILDTCFPDKSLDEVLEEAKHADRAYLVRLGSLALFKIPGILMDRIIDLLGCDKETLLQLKPGEVLDVLEAWWDLNDLTDFFKRVWSKVRPRFQTTNFGFKDGSQLQKALESVSDL